MSKFSDNDESPDNSQSMFEEFFSLAEWAHKAAQELASHTTLVDWHAKSKRLNEQIEGNDAIGYEWRFWHKQQDEGRAAKERITMLFDEYRKLTNRPV